MGDGVKQIRMNFDRCARQSSGQRKSAPRLLRLWRKALCMATTHSPAHKQRSPARFSTTPATANSKLLMKRKSRDPAHDTSRAIHDLECLQRAAPLTLRAAADVRQEGDRE